MPSDRWTRIEEIFKEASGLQGEERSSWLEEACAGDEALKAEVESLLAHDESGSGESIAGAVHGAVGGPSEPSPTEGAGFAGPGERVGPYRIEKEIGRGGMGAVYLAVRADDQFNKQVAIKVMGRSRGRPDLLQRFQTERQILATLEHPNIARMLDGGSTAAGEPYVVMEYVEGESLDTYCNQRRLGTRDRLKLFEDVCGAVQYAHRNLIVHRDLKPGNILVTHDGAVKLLDFGIAKLLNPEMSPVTVAHTATEHRVLTPEYASPEQMKGEGITTATDVYGLGVVLYEILTGRRPYRLKNVTTGELERAIVDQEPERPSTAVTRDEPSTVSGRRGDAETIGRERGTAPDRLRRQLSGDLDNIVLTALRKEPSRRYPSAEALAEDIRRHLEGLPVSARPSTLGYRTSKFLRRNTAAVVGSVAVLGIIVALVSFYTIQLRNEKDRAQAAEQRAVNEAGTAEATAEFLTGLFATADPRQEGRRDVNAEDLLHAGLQQLSTDESLSPGTRADLHLTLGLALANLGKEDEGIESLRLAITEHQEVYGRESLETAEALHRLGDVLRRGARFEEGLALLREALAIRERLLEGDTYEMADSYNNLAIMVINMGEYAESDRLQSASVEMHTRLIGQDHPQVAVPLNNLALLKYRQGFLAKAKELSGRSYEILSRGTDNSSALLARFNLARIMRDRGDTAAALAEFRTIHRTQLQLLGPDHRRTQTSSREVGASLILLGEVEEARRHLRGLLAAIEAGQGPSSRSYAAVQAEVALMDRMEGRRDRAEALMREVVRKTIEGSGPRHFGLPGRKRQLAETLIESGKLVEAESVIRGALELLPLPGEYLHIERARLQIRLARICRETGREEEGAAALREAGSIIAATIGEGSLEEGLLLVQRAALGPAPGDGEAMAILERADEILDRFVPEMHPDRRELGHLLQMISAPGGSVRDGGSTKKKQAGAPGAGS